MSGLEILVCFLSFLVGWFSFTTLIMCTFYAIPYINSLGKDYEPYKTTYKNSIILHFAIAIIVVALMSTVLYAYIYHILICYFIIPFIIALFLKNQAVSEVVERIRKVETSYEIEKDLIEELKKFSNNDNQENKKE